DEPDSPTDLIIPVSRRFKSAQPVPIRRRTIDGGPLLDQKTVTCHVTAKVLKSSPTRVAAPVLYANLSDCLVRRGIANVEPTRVLLLRSPAGTPLRDVSPPAYHVPSKAAHARRPNSEVTRPW